MQNNKKSSWALPWLRADKGAMKTMAIVAVAYAAAIAIGLLYPNNKSEPVPPSTKTESAPLQPSAQKTVLDYSTYKHDRYNIRSIDSRCVNKMANTLDSMAVLNPLTRGFVMDLIDNDNGIVIVPDTSKIFQSYKYGRAFYQNRWMWISDGYMNPGNEGFLWNTTLHEGRHAQQDRYGILLMSSTKLTDDLLYSYVMQTRKESDATAYAQLCLYGINKNLAGTTTFNYIKQVDTTKRPATGYWRGDITQEQVQPEFDKLTFIGYMVEKKVLSHTLPKNTIEQNLVSKYPPVQKDSILGEYLKRFDVMPIPRVTDDGESRPLYYIARNSYGKNTELSLFYILFADDNDTFYLYPNFAKTRQELAKYNRDPKEFTNKLRLMYREQNPEMYQPGKNK